MNSENTDPLPITEQENPNTTHLSSLPTREIVRLMNDEDTVVAAAVGLVVPELVTAIEGIVSRLQNGGRLFYIGTGTSGRLGVLDAAERRRRGHLDRHHRDHSRVAGVGRGDRRARPGRRAGGATGRQRVGRPAQQRRLPPRRCAPPRHVRSAPPRRTRQPPARRREKLAINLEDGIDEIALALTADAYSRTWRSQVITVGDGKAVTTRRGLRLVPERRAEEASFDHLLASLQSEQPAKALVSALDDIARRYDKPTAAFVARQLEYPWGGQSRSAALLDVDDATLR
mgnify:CR=1 FL=1